MGMKLWYVNVEGFKVEAETYDEAWAKAYAYARIDLNTEPTDVTLCEEEYCSECLETTCKDNPDRVLIYEYKGISNEKDR